MKSSKQDERVREKHLHKTVNKHSRFFGFY